MLKSLPALLVMLSSVFAKGQVPVLMPAGQKPNIILIVADDLGYGDVGCYGQQKIHTPNIDRMAKAGMKFTQFYAGTSVCAPSRASLMTGLHTGHTAVRGNRGFKPEGQFPLPDSTLTIARLLEANGYATAAFGKWGLGYPGSGGVPLKQGFDEFFGYNCQTEAHNYYPDHLWHNDARIELAGNRQSDSVYSADLIHEKALLFLEQQQAKPFFLFLPYTLPHASLYGPHDSIYNNYRRQFNEAPVPEDKTKKNDYHYEPYPHAAYAAMVTRLDHYVGDILKAVAKNGLSENTLIIFTSDNGPHREGGGDPDYFQSSGPLRGIKRDLYEGGIRVPFIAVWKRTIDAGSTSSFAGGFWDLFPTFADMGHIPVPATIDGLSFLPVLFGEARPAKQHPYLYWEFHESGGRQAVRMGKWKGVKLNVSTETRPATELYDLSRDPAEQHNIAAENPEVVRRINKIMMESHCYDKNWPLLLSEKK